MVQRPCRLATHFFEPRGPAQVLGTAGGSAHRDHVGPVEVVHGAGTLAGNQRPVQEVSHRQGAPAKLRCAAVATGRFRDELDLGQQKRGSVAGDRPAVIVE
jgi:hypothetical protein